jgi:hypothetical protein
MWTTYKGLTVPDSTTGDAGGYLKADLVELADRSPSYVAKTSTYSIATTDFLINCTSGTFTATLPTAVGVEAKVYWIKNSGTGVITVATTSSQTIDSSTTYVLRNRYETIQVMSDGANWIVLK